MPHARQVAKNALVVAVERDVRAATRGAAWRMATAAPSVNEQRRAPELNGVDDEGLVGERKAKRLSTLAHAARLPSAPRTRQIPLISDCRGPGSFLARFQHGATSS